MMVSKPVRPTNLYTGSHSSLPRGNTSNVTSPSEDIQDGAADYDRNKVKLKIYWDGDDRDMLTAQNSGNRL